MSGNSISQINGGLNIVLVMVIVKNKKQKQTEYGACPFSSSSLKKTFALSMAQNDPHMVQERSFSGFRLSLILRAVSP